MFTPYFGPSIIVHLLVILILRLLMLIPYFKRKTRRRRSSNEHVPFNGIIILVTISLVYLSAAPLLYLSVTGERSSVKLVTETVTAIRATTLNKLDDNNYTAIPPVTYGPEIIEDNTKECQIVAKYMDIYNGSVINFLEFYQMDTSYDFRAQLAAEFGIADYTGSLEQNKELLARLIVVDTGFNLDANSCQELK